MLERPDLDDGALARHVRLGWDLTVAAVEFMPVGNDSDAWAYEVRCRAGGRYFLKVRRGALDPAAVLVPRHLRDCGMTNVVAAIATADGGLWREADGYRLLLYPFVPGEMGMWRERGLSDAQWIEYGGFLRTLHGTDLAPELAAHVRQETFEPVWSPRVRAFAARDWGRGGSDQYEQALARSWRKRADEIAFILRRTDELAALAAAARLPFVLCHADIHTANLLVDDDRMSVIDWDEVILAPRERDLMFVLDATIGEPVTPRQEALFRRGYGDVEVDWPVFAYYRYEWVVQEIGDYTVRALDTDLGARTRADAVKWFDNLFEPGSVADAARRCERHLHGPDPGPGPDRRSAVR